MDEKTDPDPEQIPNQFGILDVAGECNRLHQKNVEAARTEIVRASANCSLLRKMN
jgi:hypothetical protein